MGEEKRKFERYKVDLNARWSSGENRVPAHISTIGLGGCFVESDTEPSIGSTLDLEIESPLSPGLWIEFKIKPVYWLDAGGFGGIFSRQGFGASFEELSPTLRDQVSQIIQRSSQ